MAGLPPESFGSRIRCYGCGVNRVMTIDGTRQSVDVPIAAMSLASGWLVDGHGDAPTSVGFGRVTFKPSAERILDCDGLAVWTPDGISMAGATQTMYDELNTDGRGRTDLQAKILPAARTAPIKTIATPICSGRRAIALDGKIQ